jgi:hypothetical protein
MKLSNCIRLFILAVFCASIAAAEPQPDLWFQSAGGSARTLPKGRWTIGIFQPLRYGVSDRIELSAHPLLFLLLPNLSAKWAHGSAGSWQLASRHSFYDPTPLLRLLGREGTGGIISPEFKIPNMGAWTSELLLTRKLGDEHFITAKAGLSFCLFRVGNLDSRTTIDLPLVYPRLQPFYHGYNWRGGVESLGRLYRRWHYLADADFFFTPKGNEQWALEHKGMLLWDKSSRLQLGLGYKLTYGEYPFGSQWHLLGPLVDVQWGWGGD